MAENVCVVGLGNMGGAVAERLVAVGFDVSGYDPNPAAQERLRQAGGRVADSISDAAGSAEYVLTSLPNSAAVSAAWLAADGVVAVARSGAALIELSTIDQQTMLDIATAGRQSGFDVYDCPVTGGPANARAGTLGILVGAEPGSIDRVRHVIESIGPLLEVGDIGSGKVVKLVNNMMSMGNMWVAAEAFAVGVQAGVDPDKLYDVLSVGGGRSNQFEKHFKRAIAADYAPSFSIDLARKDLGLALDLCRALDVPAPAAATAHTVYSMAIAEGFSGLDKLAIYQLYRNWAEGDSRP